MIRHASSFPRRTPLADLYSSGNDIVLSVAFIDEATGAYIDPSDVRLKITTPAGVVTTYVYGTDPVVKTATGKYTYTVLANVAGTWYYRWEAFGAWNAAKQDIFNIRA
jgi:hypothetical protein